MSTESQGFQFSYMDLPRFVLDHGNYDENTPILIDASAPSRAFSLAQAKSMAQRLARGLHAAGLEHDDTVCVVHMNDTMYPVVFLGIIMAGGRFSGANPNYTADELRHHFKVSATRFVLSDRRSLAEIHVASQGLFDAKNVMTWDRWDTLGITSQPSLNSSTADNNHDASLSLDKMVAFDDKSRAQETIAALMSTSGTTGLPKMAVRSHLSWVTENLAIQDSTTKPYQINRLLFTPFFHGFTAPLALIDALRSGHKTYTMSRFDLKKCLDYVERYRITELAAPPPVLLAFMQLSEQEREVLKSIRLVWSGGAPMSASMQNRAREMFHAEARIVQVYGMTEAGWITTFKYPEGDATGSVGRLLPTYEAKILDANNQDMTKTGKPGILHIKSPINMLGYLDNTKATSATLDTTTNWLNTGDMAHFSAASSTPTDNRLLCITSRAKDMIKLPGGWQLSPTELEYCLVAHPLIHDVAVFGFTSASTNTEIPIAHVVLKSGKVPTFAIQHLLTAQLKQYCGQTLAKYKVMDLEVRFVQGIVRSAAGKVLRGELREKEVRFRVVRDWLDGMEGV